MGPEQGDQIYGLNGVNIGENCTDKKHSVGEFIDLNKAFDASI